MNDPYVESISYRFRAHNTEFTDADPLKIEDENFEFEYKPDRVIIYPKKDYSSEDEIKKDLSPILRNWEESIFLSTDIRITFTFLESVIKVRNPDPKHQVIQLQSATLKATGSVVTILRKVHYPKPLDKYKSSDLTEEIIGNLRTYRDKDDKSLLTSYGYKILSRIEQEFGSKRGASEILNIDLELIKKLGDLLASTDPTYGRKRKQTPNFPSPESLEISDLLFIEKTLIQIALRIGEYNFDPDNLSFLEISDI